VYTSSTKRSYIKEKRESSTTIQKIAERDMDSETSQDPLWDLKRKFETHCTLLIALSSFFSSPTYLRACIRVVRSMLLGTPACCKHIVSMSFCNSSFSDHVPHNNIERPTIALADLPRTTKGRMIIYTAEVMNLTSTLVSHDDLLCR
jgi:hypothetical protein